MSNLNTYVIYFYINENKFIQRDVIKSSSKEDAIHFFNDKWKNSARITNIYQLIRYT